MKKPPASRVSLTGSLTLALLLLAPAAGAQAQTAGSGPASPSAGLSNVIATLMSQARYWQAQNQPGQSLDSLRRLLALDPTNTDALAAARSAAKSGITIPPWVFTSRAFTATRRRPVIQWNIIKL